MLQEPQCRRRYCVLQMKDGLKVWAFLNRLSFCLPSVRYRASARQASVLEERVIVLLPLEPNVPAGRRGKQADEYCMIRAGGGRWGSGCSPHSTEAHTHACPGDACDIGKCLSGLFSPLPVLPPNSTSQSSALLTMAHRPPRHSGFSFGVSGNASCFSLLSFLGLDL